MHAQSLSAAIFYFVLKIPQADSWLFHLLSLQNQLAHF